MDKEKELVERKMTRLRAFDYSKVGAYFLTICTDNRREVLSEIVGDDVLGVPKKNNADAVGKSNLIVPGNVKLLTYGEIANKYIIQLNDFYENIHIDAYVIMPNHIHILMRIGRNGTPRTSSPTRQTSTVSHFISTFKRFCNKDYGANIWQRGFYDHIIRCAEDYDEIKKYIYENPLNWYYSAFTEYNSS